jgi:hypothetical protein
MSGVIVADMRLGVGGGAFGVRGGISTRGVGVGAGPFSAGTSWGRRRGGGDGGFIGFAIIAVVGVLAVAWPYLLGTFVAVQLGADNPSTARTVVGSIFEVAYIAGLICWFTLTREMRAQKAAEQPQRHAELVASGVVYEARNVSSSVYRHGSCTVNHRSHETAAKCRTR